jgi:predicted RNase H-like HicB family nuclease
VNFVLDTNAVSETETEALQNIREAMEIYIESLAAHNEPIPREEIMIHSIPVAI